MLQFGLLLKPRPFVPPRVDAPVLFRGRLLAGDLRSGKNLPSINQLGRAMTLAMDGGSASDGHARRGRHELTPTGANCRHAGHHRWKLQVGSDNTGDLSKAQGLVILSSTARLSSTPAKPGSPGDSRRRNSDNERRGGPGPPLSGTQFPLLQRMACAARRISSASGCIGPKSGTLSRAPPCTRISAAPVSVSLVRPDFTSSIASSSETQSRIRIA